MKPQNTGKFSKNEKNIKIQLHIKFFAKRINNNFTTKIRIPAASVSLNVTLMLFRKRSNL
jgi:hypothetical protein